MFFVVGVQADGCFSALGFAVLNQIGADFVVNFFKIAAFKDAAVASPRDKLAVYLFKAVAFALTVAYVFFVFFNEIVGADAVEVAVLLGIFPGCRFEALNLSPCCACISAAFCSISSLKDLTSGLISFSGRAFFSSSISSLLSMAVPS